MCDLPMSDADGPRFGEPLLDTFRAEIPDGLAVKEDRQVSLRVRSPFVGVLTYQEQASFLLSGRP